MTSDRSPGPWRFALRSTEWVVGPRTLVMGIVNVTTDSFSGDGLAGDPERAVAQGIRMVSEGADLLDVGGESTRPGAKPVPLEEELRRVVPVVAQLRKAVACPISVDTQKAEVARQAIGAGADIINDISGLRQDPALAELSAATKAPVILMHMRGEPKTMQDAPTYADVVAEIMEFFVRRMEELSRQGVSPHHVLVDPGIGFGKTVEHNLTILRRLRELAALGRPLVVGTSRKSFIGKVLDLPVEDRLEGTAATVAVAIAHGANIVRVHDVKAMRRVVRMCDAILK